MTQLKCRWCRILQASINLHLSSYTMLMLANYREKSRKTSGYKKSRQIKSVRRRIWTEIILLYYQNRDLRCNFIFILWIIRATLILWCSCESTNVKFLWSTFSRQLTQLTILRSYMPKLTDGYNRCNLHTNIWHANHTKFWEACRSKFAARCGNRNDWRDVLSKQMNVDLNRLTSMVHSYHLLFQKHTPNRSLYKFWL